MRSDEFPQPGKERMGSTVKKFLSMLLIGAVLGTSFLSTGCGDDKKDTKKKDDTTKKEEKKDKG